MVRRIKNIGHWLLAVFATIIYGFPAGKLTVIGITGTDGKTSTTYLLYHLLKKAKLPVSMISTVKAVIGSQIYDTGFHVTTPSAFFLQKLLKKAKSEGSRFLVLETTSHALDQFRTLGTSIDIAVITNISHEHLDYHGNLEKYLEAKAKILKGVKTAILNRDDASFNTLKKKVKGKTITFSLDKTADYTPRSVDLPESEPAFQKANMLAAVAAAREAGVDLKTAEKALRTFSGVPGRMERVKNGHGINVIIDFAHKINALKEALAFARTQTRNKLIVVFGTAGLRDRLKRPIMGELAAKAADFAVLTAEDPRTEDVRNIIAQIAKGCLNAGMQEKNKNFGGNNLQRKNKYFFRIPDRQEAINFAIRKLAKKGDTVIVCGKGHEKSMCYGKIEYPWDEKQAVLKALDF